MKSKELYRNLYLRIFFLSRLKPKSIPSNKSPAEIMYFKAYIVTS